MRMIRLLVACLALAGLVVATSALPPMKAQAATKVHAKKKKKATTRAAKQTAKRARLARASGKSRKRARRGLKRRYNFTAGRRTSSRPVARRKSANQQLRVASLLGRITAKATPSRRPGQIYDASGRYLGKTIVPFKRKLKPGTILVKTRERALYYVLPGGKAIKYGVGVGREGFTWTGRHRITAKKEWPEWRPPEEMKQRELAKYGRKLPDVMPGGPDNPLGARALYIGNTLYRIHGTNNPRSIGKFVSSGCIRMRNDEVIELYDKVKIGAPVIVED